MKWALYWREEQERGIYIDHEDWAYSWEEVIGYFMEWMSKSSDVVKGEVICYLGDKPYCGGTPCLYMNVQCNEVSE